MDIIKRFEPLMLLIVVIGALSWGIIGLFDTNVLSEVFGTGTLLDVVYVVVGVAGLTYVPRLLEAMTDMGHHGTRPHHA
jgi:uncharacterized membrane protein YuzA (DUF378 family)